MDTANINEGTDVKVGITVEVALYDVLHRMFSYLSLKELCEARLVCKSWNKIADLELSKRNDIEIGIVPIQLGSDDKHSDYGLLFEEDEDEYTKKSKYRKDKWHISNCIRALPKLVLLFRQLDQNYDFVNGVIMYDYHWKMVKSGTITASHYTPLGIFLNNREINSNENFGVALTMPSTSKLKCTAHFQEYCLKKYMKTDKIAEYFDKLLDNLSLPEDSHSCLLVFRGMGVGVCDDARYIREFHRKFYECVSSNFAASLKKRCKPGSYTLWGGETSPFFYSNIYNSDVGNEKRDLFQEFFVIKISGSAFKSWSIVVKLNITDIEKKEQLIDFKKELRLKSSTVALAIAPSNENETSEQKLDKTKIFREVFPKIPLLTICETDDLVQFGVNTIRCDSDPQLTHKGSVVYCVMTTE